MNMDMMEECSTYVASEISNITLILAEISLLVDGFRGWGVWWWVGVEFHRLLQFKSRSSLEGGHITRL